MKNLNFSCEALFSTFFDSSPICIWIKDLENNLLKLNQAAADLEMKTAEEMEGKSCFDLYPEERAQAFWKDDNEVIKSGESKLGYYELHIIPGTNVGKWLQVNKIPIKNNEGAVTGLMVYAIDVTDIKLAEEETRKREEHLQKLMDIAPFPIAISSLEENKFLYLNYAAARLFNISVEDALLLNPESIYLEKYQRSLIQQLLKENQELKAQEITFKRSNGALIYGLLSAIRIEYLGIPSAYVILNDITEFKKNEIKLSQVAEEFRVVFENSTDAIFWADSDTGIIINCNRSAEELLQADRTKIIGKEHWEIHPKESHDFYRKLFSDTGKTKPEGMELEVEDSTGKIIPVRIAVNTVDFQNKRITQAVVSNISERVASNKALKESEQRYRAVVSNAPVVFFEIDPHGIFKFSDGKGEFMHLKAGEAAGKSIYEIYKNYPDYLAQTEKALQGNSLNLTMELENVVLDTFFSPVKNALGEVTSTIGVAVDISDRRKVEKKLSEERNILRTVIDIIPDFIYVKDNKGRFIVCNQSAAKFLKGNTPDDIIGKTDFDFFPHSEAQKFFNEEQEILIHRKAVINMEIMDKVDGKEHYSEITKIPYYAPNGQVSGLVGTSRDITQRKKSEAAIRESESKFRLMTENMKDVIWQLSTDMNFTYLSPSFYQLTGFPPSEFIGKSIWSMITKDSAVNLQNLLQKRRSSGNAEQQRGSLVFEASQYHADNSLIWTEIMSSPVFNEKGELLHFQGITRDITQRKLTELALKESQEKLGVVVANAPIVLFQIDKEGIFRFSEGKGLEKLGLLPSQVVGLSVFDVYKDFPKVQEQVNEAMNGKVVRDILNVLETYFEIQYNPVYNSSGEVESIIGIAFDITERKLAQDALLESEIRFKTLFHEMTEGVALHELILDENNTPVNYKILEVNPAFFQQTGLEEENPTNKLATELYNSPVPPFLNEFSEVALWGGSSNFETYFEPLEKYLKISVVSPGKNRFATVFEDVTVQKKHEKELKHKNEELERFTYTVSHDLKSPLVTIKGFIGMLEQDLLLQHKENISDDMQRIKSATDKMTNLLNDLLELSRIGRNINPPVKVPMLSVINEAVELLSGILTERSVSIEIPSSLPEVYVDKQRMVEVWLNLIENAAKFSGKQENPKIFINYTKEDTKFIFSIKDNGIGIDKKYHQVVFGLFNKLDNKSNGTGIGLALVKRIIEVHGGDIWVESEGVGMGTKFSFSVPVKLINQKPDK